MEINGYIMICPDCGSQDIESLGYDYSPRVVYECIECGHTGHEEDFDARVVYECIECGHTGHEEDFDE
jgi:Zn ribbon nucleic-acid-binding protein